MSDSLLEEGGCVCHVLIKLQGGPLNCNIYESLVRGSGFRAMALLNIWENSL